MWNRFGKFVKYILKQIIMKCQKLSPLFAALTVGAKKTFDSKNVILEKP